ncbi:amidohydrolase family protein [Streptomyces sp. NPDC051985]|uniref:amidohydrolase family protein n=1 Tax=Streptomyces sp. NPDC051985 TaxID=3155807 RepID=UPI00342FA85F
MGMEAEVSFADVKVIDCDAHWTEPSDLWSARVPAGLEDQVPVQKTVDGRTAWYLDGEVWASTGGNTITVDRKKILGSHVVQPFADVDRSAWAVKERLEIMDDMGIHAQILYPNGIGFASNHIFAIKDERQRQLVLSLYNDHLIEVQRASGNRLFPQGVLPVWDMDLTIKEMTRLVDQGMRGFTLSDKPELLGLPELAEPYFEPMWDLFNESGAVANFHIASGQRREDLEALRNPTTIPVDQTRQRQPKLQKPPAVAAPTWRMFGPQRRLAVSAAQMYMSNVRIIVNLCNSELFDRFPNLKIVSAESGIGWVPFLLEAMEYQYDEMLTLPHELGLTRRRPIEYFRDHIFVMFWFERSAPEKLIEDIGVNNILVETDLPHPTCLYPTPKEHFDRVLSGVGEQARRRILQDNAAELYRIPLS